MNPFSMVSLILVLVLVVAGCAAPTVASAPPPTARNDSPAEPSTLEQYHRAAAIAAERAGDTERAAAHRSFLTR